MAPDPQPVPPSVRAAAWAVVPAGGEGPDEGEAVPGLEPAVPTSRGARPAAAALNPMVGQWIGGRQTMAENYPLPPPVLPSHTALTATGLSRDTFDHNPALDTFFDPINQLAQIDPLAALAALDPVAALASVSPVLRLFNPAFNPAAALLAFNPGAAPTLAITNPTPAGVTLSPAFYAGLRLPFLI